MQKKKLPPSKNKHQITPTELRELDSLFDDHGSVIVGKREDRPRFEPRFPKKAK